MYVHVALIKHMIVQCRCTRRHLVIVGIQVNAGGTVVHGLDGEVLSKVGGRRIGVEGVHKVPQVVLATYEEGVGVLPGCVQVIPVLETGIAQPLYLLHVLCSRLFVCLFVCVNNMCTCRE